MLDTKSDTKSLAQCFRLGYIGSMQNESLINKYFKTQAKLAAVIANGEITTAARIKAHRIWHGKRKPNDAEMALIYSSTGGKLDANYFAGLNIKNSKNRRSN